MGEVIYRLVSTSEKRVIESPFCLCGERIAAFYLEEAALKIARALRESEWKTVYGCYAQPDGAFLIGLASARAGGKFRQRLSLKNVTDRFDPSLPVWKNASVKRISGPLDEFVHACLRSVNQQTAAPREVPSRNFHGSVYVKR